MNKRFIWEDRIVVNEKKAKKSRRYREMKKRKREIRDEINKIKDAKRLSELAEEYGVLSFFRVNSDMIRFNDGKLGVNFDEIEKRRDRELNEDTYLGVLEEAKECFERAIEEQEIYLQRAKKYLKDSDASESSDLSDLDLGCARELEKQAKKKYGEE